MSDARCLSNQVHFFISSYPCQALQLADQQSVAVCFNQAAPPLLQTGPDYREREQGRDEEGSRGRGRRGEGRRGGGRQRGGGGCLYLAITEMKGVKQGTCKYKMYKMESKAVASVGV